MLLIVDDCRDTRESLAEVFAVLGYRSVLASSGPEALRVLALEGEAIELVILDLAMPGMDGFEVARTIGHSKPVVVVSGVTTRRPPETSVAYLCKPASVEDLLHYVRRFCRRADTAEGQRDRLAQAICIDEPLIIESTGN
jgi:DNA-binding response OmpR family regulator